MELYDSIRNQAKMDSRRFGKGVVCRIVVGQLLDILYKEGMVPNGVYINQQGLDPINHKMFVIPVVKYPEIERLVKDYQPTLTEDQKRKMDLEAVETVTQSKSGLVKALRQNIVLVTLNMNVPHGQQAGLDPNYHDVIIDSLDVNQTIEATYVYRTVENIRGEKNFNDPAGS